jgi:hypothetical protein
VDRLTMAIRNLASQIHESRESERKFCKSK